MWRQIFICLVNFKCTVQVNMVRFSQTGLYFSCQNEQKQKNPNIGKNEEETKKEQFLKNTFLDECPIVSVKMFCCFDEKL